MKKMADMSVVEREEARKAKGLICSECSRGQDDIKQELCRSHSNFLKKHGSFHTRTRMMPNKIVGTGDVLSVELYDANNEVKAVTTIDSEDRDEVAKFKWCLTSKGYVQATTSNYGNAMSMHRYLMGFPAMTVDHIDNNPLNNCKSNLRVADMYGQNRNRRNNSRSRIRGVYQSGSVKNPFIVRVWARGQNINVGLFADAEEAAMVYDCVAPQLIEQKEFIKFNYA